MYDQRRQKLMEKMGQGSVGIWMASSSKIRSNDTEYRYRTSSDLFYLTGCSVPEAVLILRPDAEKEKVVLFVRPRDAEKEIWTGRRFGATRAKEYFNVDAAYATDELDKKIEDYLVGADRLYYRFGVESEQDKRVLGWVETVKRQRRFGKRTPSHLIDSSNLVHEMRLIKDQFEIDIMRKAADISVDMHKMAMKATRPDMEEYELDSLLQYHCRLNGCADTSYLSIVGGGSNAAVLHYVENDQHLKDGELLLIDAGAEYQHYAGDITRTFPINGKFSDKQKQVYEIVLSAMESAFEQCKPNNRFIDIHDAAVRRLTEGLIELGVLEGELDQLIKDEAYKPYYMHKTSHWLGLDVHDVGSYFEEDGSSRILRAGMVLTVEPGLYFNPNFYKDAEKADPYKNIGIRIEDDILITDDGYENLTKDAPKTVSAIESLISSQ